MATTREDETTDGRRAGKLSRRDWIEAAYAVLGIEGVEGLRIPKVATWLGATKGSFYWHFDGLAELHEGLIDRWGNERTQEFARAAARGSVSPRDMLRALGRAAREIGPVDREMRAWARRDQRVREAVEAADSVLYTELLRALENMGYGGDDARTRALLLFLAGVGGTAVDHNVGGKRFEGAGEAMLDIAIGPEKSHPEDEEDGE